jgi:hypothetical protein
MYRPLTGSITFFFIGPFIFFFLDHDPAREPVTPSINFKPRKVESERKSLLITAMLAMEI